MKKFFALYVIAIIAVVIGTTTARAGTIAHWTFEEGTPGATASGVGTIIDSSANNLHGTALGGPVYQDGLISGTGNTGLNFDGNNDTVHVSSGSTGPLALAGDFTIELSVRADIPNALGFGVFYGDTQPSKDPYFIFMDGNGKLTFQIYGGATTASLQTANGALQIGKTTQIAAVFDYDDIDGSNNIMSIYVDRMLVVDLDIGTTVPFYGDTSSDFWIGSVHDNGNPGRYFRGGLTDVKISDSALTGSEMMLVPEPGMMAIFGVGLLALGLTRRKRS